MFCLLLITKYATIFKIIFFYSIKALNKFNISICIYGPHEAVKNSTNFNYLLFVRQLIIQKKIVWGEEERRMKNIILPYIFLYVNVGTKSNSIEVKCIENI